MLEYNEIRLTDSIKIFYQHEEYLLAIVILATTIILPIIKYSIITNQIFRLIKFSKNVIEFLHYLDKWSMLDVFIVALLLINFKMDSRIIVMKILIGTTFLALSIIFRLLTVLMIDVCDRFHEKGR